MDEEKKTQGEEIPGKAEAEGPAAEDRRTTDAPDVQTDAPQTAQTNAAPEDESEDDEGGEGRHGASAIRSPTNFSRFRSKPRCASPTLTTR